MPRLTSVMEGGMEEFEFAIDTPPGDFGTRVFIGGNYRFASVLYQIKEAVVACGYQPILVFEFQIPEAATRDCSLQLLRQCKFAIFEVTMDGGSMIEMERAVDYGTTSLCLWDALATDSPKISAMVTSHPVFRANSQGYKGPRQLDEAVTSFLNAQQPE